MATKTITVSVLASFLLAVGLVPTPVQGERLGAGGSTNQNDQTQQKIGRPVRLVSLSFNGKSLDEIAQVVEREAAAGADLILLPETWRGQKDSPETLSGPTISTMAALARKH